MPPDRTAIGPLRGELALHLGGSLAHTASALTTVPVAPAPAPTRGRGQAPPAPPAEDPAEHLARLMDLHGSVALARELENQAATPPALPLRGQRNGLGAASAMRAVVEDRLLELAGTVQKTFEEPFHRRNRVPGPREMFALLEQTGMLGPSRRISAGAVTAIWEPFGELVGRMFTRIRFEVQSLRQEIAPGLRAFGPESARLEQLDTMIGRATEKGRERVLGELAPALGRCFGQSLHVAVGALPDEVKPPELQGWFGDRGWVRGEMERMRRVVEAVFTHQTRRLVALVDAAGMPLAPYAG
ncbi:DUF3348 family protein [Chondromyces crocatus]|uniref:Uncharacterized protein n=1 Tax=Chondromyces crocatus TaxID=52 RepID=A0A0K1E512_CHOCO|nr:DUF3348 family protein [Chondromyces crocatus]AKT35970.1 uncharacterized protein CMC5_000820 [Chondromyces crocatus]